MNASPSPVPTETLAHKAITRGILEIPPNARAIIVFAHGKDSSKLSPRNRLVARSLLQRGFAVLLPDFSVNDGDDADYQSAGDHAGILETAASLISIIDWLAANPATSSLRIGLFGGRTGAAATMIAAARRPEKVHAIVSRGGRPDLAEELLEEVRTPTLMIVGSNDSTHIQLNRQAREKMHGKPMLELIPGATHLFGEPGKLEQVASISYLWFQRNLAMCG